MSNAREGNPPSWRRGLLTAVAFSVPASAIAASVRHLAGPLAAGVAVFAYTAALLSIGFFVKVAKKLEARWVERVVDYVDKAVTYRISPFGRRYREHVTSLHRFIDLRGLGTQGSITPRVEDVFVDVSLVQRPAHQASGDPVPAFEDPDTAWGDRRPVWAFLNSADNAPLTIVGAAGSGKTTLLRHIALQLCRKARGSIPVILFLREHASSIARDPATPLSELVRSSLGALARKQPAEWLEHQLDRGRCIVMLDGLDEVASEEQREQVVAWVANQVAQYNHCQFVVTSRPHGYQPHPLPGATVLHVRPFTPSQIEQFIKGWYVATQVARTQLDDQSVRENAAAEARDLLARLYASPSLYELAVNPLLLTMIANVHSYRGALPGSRAELYAEICHVFLGKRQEAKGLADNLRADQKELVLRQLALHMMMAEVRDISRAAAATIIEPTLSAVTKEFGPEAFLRSVEESSGLFLEREVGVYSFAHLTFQEFLAAAQVQEDGNSKLLAERHHLPWWRETILLYVARADGGPIVERCLDAGSPYALALALDVSDEAQRLDSDLRRRIEDWVVDEGRSASFDHQSLYAAVRLARKVRNIVRLGSSDVHICAEAVTNAEYDLFLHLFRRDSAPDTWRRAAIHTSTRSSRQPDKPLLGVSPKSALAFCGWLTAMLDDGWTYRPPTVMEVAEPAVLARLLDLQIAPLPSAFWVANTSPSRRVISVPYGVKAADRGRLQRILEEEQNWLLLGEELTGDYDVEQVVVSDLRHVFTRAEDALAIRQKQSYERPVRPFLDGDAELAALIAHLLLPNGDHLVRLGRNTYRVMLRSTGLTGRPSALSRRAARVVAFGAPTEHRWNELTHRVIRRSFGRRRNSVNVDQVLLHLSFLETEDESRQNDVRIAGEVRKLVLSALEAPYAGESKIHLRTARLMLLPLACAAILDTHSQDNIRTLLGERALALVELLAIMQARLEGDLPATEGLVLVRS